MDLTTEPPWGRYFLVDYGVVVPNNLLGLEVPQPFEHGGGAHYVAEYQSDRAVRRRLRPEVGTLGRCWRKGAKSHCRVLHAVQGFVEHLTQCGQVALVLLLAGSGTILDFGNQPFIVLKLAIGGGGGQYLTQSIGYLGTGLRLHGQDLLRGAAGKGPGPGQLGQHLCLLCSGGSYQSFDTYFGERIDTLQFPSVLVAPFPECGCRLPLGAPSNLTPTPLPGAPNSMRNPSRWSSRLTPL